MTNLVKNKGIMKDNKYWQNRCSKFRLRLLDRMTEYEKIVEDFLKSREIAYIAQKGFFADGRTCIVDFYVPKYKTCIEVDGQYHYLAEQQIKDMSRDSYLTKTRKLAVIRIANHQAACGVELEKLLSIMTNIKRGKREVMYDAV